jgi:single-stranded-DNA-specific exonuclease
VSDSVWREAGGWRDRAVALQSRHGLPWVLAMLLSRTPWKDGELEDFLQPDRVPWPDPERIPELADGAKRIMKAVALKEPILVHGDYDVDGLMGSAILVGGLKPLGALVDAFIPSRFDGGYGLSEASLTAAERHGARLVVTTDCGTNATDVIVTLQGRGVDVVVTDHHIPSLGERAPCIVVNPHLEEGHPDQGLCGAFVALQMLRQVMKEAGQERPLEPFLRLAAIATVADVVPMNPVNRRLCKAGFKAMESTPNPGLSLLLRQARVHGDIRGHHIAFHVAPRFNAAGRMEDARLVLDLLLAREPARAAALMGRLESLNLKRKALQATAFDEANGQALARGPSRVVFAASSRWHRGVIGPVAARLAETHRRSAFVVAIENGEGVGSARSWREDNVCLLLGSVGHLLGRFGGHEGAAGFTVQAGNVENLAQALMACPALEEKEASEELFFPMETKDMSAAWEAWGVLDPFGPGHEEPFVGVTGLVGRGQRVVGNKHVIWSVDLPGGGGLMNVIAWDGLRRGIQPSSLTPSRTLIGRLAPEYRPSGLPFYFNVQAIL